MVKTTKVRTPRRPRLGAVETQSVSGFASPGHSSGPRDHACPTADSALQARRTATTRRSNAHLRGVRFEPGVLKNQARFRSLEACQQTQHLEQECEAHARIHSFSSSSVSWPDLPLGKRTTATKRFGSLQQPDNWHKVVFADCAQLQNIEKVRTETLGPSVSGTQVRDAQNVTFLCNVISLGQIEAFIENLS